MCIRDRDRCVPIRLGDLYEGMELGQCLDIIRTVKDDSIAAGIEVMKNQGCLLYIS